MLSPLPTVVYSIVAAWLQTVGPTIAGELLDLLALILRLRLMRSELLDCPQLIAAQKLDSALQCASQESVRFGPEVSLLARRPREYIGMTSVIYNDLVGPII